MFEDVAVHHPPAPVDRYHADVDGLAPTEQHGVAKVGCVHGLPVARDDLEELPVDVHRVEPCRVVLEADADPASTFELGHLMFAPGAPVDRPLDPVLAP